MTKLYMRHIRKCTFCATGFIAFCKERNLDYTSFFKHGIEIEDLKKQLGAEINHTLVNRAIQLAEGEANGK